MSHKEASQAFSKDFMGFFLAYFNNQNNLLLIYVKNYFDRISNWSLFLNHISAKNGKLETLNRKSDFMLKIGSLYAKKSDFSRIDEAHPNAQVWRNYFMLLEHCPQDLHPTFE